jgi:hypothetical protein
LLNGAAVCYLRSICEAEVDETYIQYLTALNQKMVFAEKQTPETVCQSGAAHVILSTPRGQVAARRDVGPELEKLRIKVASALACRSDATQAVAKIREFLLEKVASMKRPKTNVQIIQQSVLVKYKYGALPHAGGAYSLSLSQVLDPLLGQVRA